jgi:putative phage-type endonuclease
MITKNGLELIPLKGVSRAEWLLKRQDGIGGSDISSILGLNYRFSAIELFYQKCGFTQANNDQNEAIFWGTNNENNVLDIAQYYDIDTGGYIDNFETGNKLRRITKMQYMVRNPKYPWLLANLDGAVNFRARSFKMDGPAEAKTISRQTAEMWQAKIPPYHISQINTYCIVCEPMMLTDSAHIFYLEDGRIFRGYRIPVIESLKEQILTRSEIFWRSILKGREIMADIKDNDLRLKYLAEIEPAPDSTESYSKFLSELFQLKSAFIRVDGTDEDAINAIAYKKIHNEIKSLEEQKQEFKNKIYKTLHDKGANVIDFGAGGKVSYNKKLYVNVKPQILEAA